MQIALSILLVFLFCGTASAQAPESEQQFASIGDLELVSGETLYDTRVGYRTLGTLNEDRSNVIVFPTWFSGTSENMIQFGKVGPGKLADTDRYFVIVIDALGNGVSTSPSNSERQGGADFPQIAIDDMVTAGQKLLTEHLGFDHVYAVAGVSMGGMQAFQWIGQYPGFMDKAVAVDGSPRMTSYDLAQWEALENVIVTLQSAGFDDKQTMEFLTSIALLTLWTPDYFVENVTPEAWPGFLDQMKQGFGRINPDDYLVQLRAMTGHDVYADHPDPDAPYSEVIQADLLVVGNRTDHVVNPNPGKSLAESIDAEYFELNNNCGHVGSSCEDPKVIDVVSDFLE